MRKSLLAQILDRCQRELISHPQYDFFAHWTFLVKNNKIISNGVNRAYEPPRCFGYHSRRDCKPKWHSEADAIRRSKRNLVDCIAVNVRLNKQGRVRLSMPCQVCRHILNVVGVKKVYFSTEYGWGSYDY